MQNAKKARVNITQQNSVASAAQEDKLGDPPRKIRRLFYDIEVSPNIVLAWRLGNKVSINYDSVLSERAVICIAWKWQGESKVYSLQWDDEQNDKEMLEQFGRAIAEADEAIFHNGSRFDLPWVKARSVYHGLKPISPNYSVDTLQLARRNFYFNSNRLDYLAKFLGVGSKIKTEYNLWKSVLLENDKIALAKMVKYCKNDVVVLEKVYNKLISFCEVSSHAGVLAGHEKWTDPRTGSTDVKLDKTRVTATGIVRYQMVSNVDGGYYTINAKAFEAYKEWKEKKKKA